MRVLDRGQAWDCASKLTLLGKLLRGQAKEAAFIGDHLCHSAKVSGLGAHSLSTRGRGTDTMSGVYAKCSATGGFFFCQAKSRRTFSDALAAIRSNP